LALGLGLIALLLRGLLVAANTALLSSSLEDAEDAAADGNERAARVVKLKQGDPMTRLGLRAGEVVLLALAVNLVAVATWRDGTIWMARFFPNLEGGVALVLFASLIALALSSVVFIVGDLLPRAWAAQGREKVAEQLAAFALICRLLALPLVLLAFSLSDLLFKHIALDLRRFQAAPPLDALEQALVERAAEDGNAAPTAELIHSIFEFGETTAKEIMIPRTQIVAVAVDTPPAEILETFANRGHTRLLVYKGELDQVVGIIHAKDLIPLVGLSTTVDLQAIVRKATFVPWSQRIHEVMREFQSQHIHLAVVVDEFGGTMGLITLEDILEEIVGEIEDEFDPPEPKDVETLPDGAFLVRASMEIEDFNEHFKTEIPLEGEFETVAGMLNLLAGAIPKVGDTFIHAGLKLRVAKRSDRRVRQVHVRKLNTESPTALGSNE